MKKTNHNRYIILFFLCIFSLPVDARQIMMQDIPADHREKIDRLDDMILSVFKLRKLSRKGARLTVCAKNCSTPSVELKNRRMKITLVSDKDLLRSPANYRALVSGLVLSTGALELNPHPEKAVPAWICAGLRERSYSFRHMERFLKGMHCLPVVEAMLHAGLFPEMSEFLSLPEQKNEAELWYRGFSRFLLETAISKKLLHPHALRLHQTQSYEDENEKLKKTLSAIFLKNQKKQTLDTVNKVLWNDYHPEPAEHKMKKLDKLLSWQIPELDKDGQETNKSKTFPLADLHIHLVKRPDAAIQRKQAAAAIEKFRSGCIKEENEPLRQIFVLLKTPADNDPEKRAEMLNKQIDLLRKKLLLRSRREKFLYSAERLHSSVVHTHQKLLNTDPGPGTASEQQKRFLLDTEKIYAD